MGNPEELARQKIDILLEEAGWTVVNRSEFSPYEINAQAVKENLMNGNKEADYMLYLDGKAIGIVEAKKGDTDLNDTVLSQAQGYATNTTTWTQTWMKPLPFIFLGNGKEFKFIDNRKVEVEYVSLKKMYTPKDLVKMSNGVVNSEFAMLPSVPAVCDKGLRQCQFEAITELEASFKLHKNRALIVLATGAGKTFTACTAAYRLLNYTPVKKVLFLVDRNNLGKQAEGEFGTYRLTETGEPFSDEYVVSRLRNVDQLKDSTVVISTIQRLFAILSGQSSFVDDDDDEESDEDENEETILVPTNVKIPSTHFDLIIIDECHRSIYGKWKQVIEYFSNAKIIGLTATPTPESYAFNNNVVSNYTLEQSVIDGVNVSPRIFRIKTQITEEGLALKEKEKVLKVSNATGNKKLEKLKEDKDYTKQDLDRSVVAPDQIKTVVEAYKNAIYESLYPERKKDWYSIPKTLFFAKSENHATLIQEVIEEVFSFEFPNHRLPEHFVQKITCKAGNSLDLIDKFRNDKDFRIAITVTLVATGTDVKPLEVLVFMRDIDSAVLYTQMKGRGCRTIDDDKLRNVTPNALQKNCYYLIDAVGVTEHEHSLPTIGKDYGKKPKVLSLRELLEHLTHGEVSDSNLNLLVSYLSTIHNRSEAEDLTELTNILGKDIKTIALNINNAMADGSLPIYEDINQLNSERKQIVSDIIKSQKGMSKLIEIYAGFIRVTDRHDVLIEAGFSLEQAKGYIDQFECYINENKDEIEALRVLYNNDKTAVSYTMLKDLEKKLTSYNRSLQVNFLWNCYKTVDGESGRVKALEQSELDVLTNIIQLVRYGYHQIEELVSLKSSYGKYFNLYCGQSWRNFTSEQVEIVKQIADYIVQNGYISNIELNNVNHELFVKAIKIFEPKKLNQELQTIASYVFYGRG